MPSVGDVVELLTRLISIDTTTADPDRGYANRGDYRRAIDELLSYCREHRLEARYIDLGDSRVGIKPHLLVKAGDRGLKLLLLTHFDTVPADVREWSTPPFEAKASGGRIYGRGAADNKGALAACLTALSELASESLENTIVLLAACDEECGGPYGVSRVAEMLAEGELGVKPDLCWVVDAYSEYIAVGASGSIILKVEVEGKGGHSAYPYKALNPIYPLAQVALEVEKWGRELEERELSEHPCAEGYAVVPARASATVLVANPSMAGNIIPERGVLKLNLRVPPGLDMRRLELEAIRRITSVVGNRWSSYRAKVEVEEAFKPYYTDLSRSREAAWLASLLREGKPELQCAVELASNDGCYFSWLPVICYGCIRRDCNIHAPDEFVYVEDLERLKEAVKKAALTEFR